MSVRSLTELLFLLVFVTVNTESPSESYGKCKVLPDPIAVHPRFGYKVRAGKLSVSREGDDIVVRTICDNEQGFVLLDNRFKEMRCSYDELSERWSWNHYHPDKTSPSTIRCAHASPKPLLQRFRLGPEFDGCADQYSKEKMLSTFKEKLTTSLPCVQADECVISDLSCEPTETDTVLSVKVTSRSTQHVVKQRLILKTAVDYLNSHPLHLILNGPSGRHSRQKRDIDFGDADTEDIVESGCSVGFIQNQDDTCSKCTAGTFANTAADTNQVCESCTHDTYSGDGATECTACGTGLRTLEIGSDTAEHCTAVCMVPSMEFVAKTSPELRVREGGDVLIVCDGGYQYGNTAKQTVTCSSSTNYFPTSCRKLTISSPAPSIKSGDAGHLTCNVETSDVGVAIQWFKGDSTTPLTSDDSSYTISTKLATSFEADGITKKSTSDLTVLSFDATDVGYYSCRVDYADPILDDSSTETTLNILDLVVTPTEAQIVSVAQTLHMSCSLNLDATYTSRTVTWKLNDADVTSGISTSTSSTAYTSTLSLSTLTLSDIGTYSCTGTYRHSDGSNPVVLVGTVVVDVRGFETHPADQTADQGSDVVMRCAVVGEQRASISWTQDSHDLSGDEDVYDDPNKKTTSTLTLRSVGADNAGVYKCRADFGGSVVESNPATLTVIDVGIIQDPANAAYLVGEDAALSCTIRNPASSTPSVTWYREAGQTATPLDVSLFNFDYANPGTSTLTFSSATMDKSGVYKCEAVYVISGQTFTQTSGTASLHIRELSKTLNEYTAANSLGGTQRFTCEYHGDDGVDGTTWVYNEGDLPAGYSVTQGSYGGNTEKWETVLTVNPILKSSGGAIKCAFSFSGTGQDITSTTTFRVRSVDPLEAEVFSSLESYTVTCTYKGSDEPSVSWLVAGSIVSESDEGISINIGSVDHDMNERNDQLVVSGRIYSDASKPITCKYMFTNPVAELTANTVLKFRGLATALNSKYYSSGAAVIMQCGLGVGSEGAAPISTFWYNIDVDANKPLVTGSTYKITTDTEVNNGLFKTTLTIKEEGITTTNDGVYRCMFSVSDSESYTSEGRLTVGLVRTDPSEDRVYSYSNAGLQLSCTLDASEGESAVTWSGPDGRIDPSQYSSSQNDPHIHILTLTGPASNGEYRCSFALSEGNVPVGIFPDVNLNLVEMVTPAALYSIYGDGVFVTLTCQVTSPSKVDLYFHDGSQDISPTNSYYADGRTVAEYAITIDSSNKEGTFQCKKSATEFSPTSSTVTVFSITEPLTSPTRGNIGTTVTFTCTAQFHADLIVPEVLWLSGDSTTQEVPEGLVVAEDSSTVQSKLPVTISLENDNSVYKCVITYSGLATHPQKSLETSTIVIMNKIVTSSPDSPVEAFVTDSATLSCVATAAPGVDIKWRKEAADYTEQNQNYITLIAEQEDYNTETGTRKSTLTLTSLMGADTSDSIECYDDAVGIFGVITLEVIETSLTPTHKEVLKGTEATISCAVELFGLTRVVKEMWWEKEDGSVISSGTDFVVVVDPYDAQTNTQTTTLTTTPDYAIRNAVDTTYTCAVTRGGGLPTKTPVHLDVYTVTSTPKDITTAVDQTLTCTIGGLDASGTPVTVTWKDNVGQVLTSDTQYYGMEQGSVDGSGNQVAELTIKAAKLAAFTSLSSVTYKCSVKSGQYADSPASDYVDVVANILKLEVTTVNKEQLTGTEATISCTVAGLTEALTAVKWTTSDSDDALTAPYTVEAGSLDGKSQSTILTILKAQNTGDVTYSCVFTSAEHTAVDRKTAVSSKVFTVTSTPKDITTAVDQTLTCTIGGLDANSGTPAIVTWKDNDDAKVKTSDTQNYGLVQGSVDSSGNQVAELTIKAAKLAAFTSLSSVTYKCSVKSGQYTDSPTSDYVDVVANILKLEVTTVNKEQLTGTEATISCTVAGLTQALTVVKWTTSANADVMSLDKGYTVKAGSLEGAAQTTTLIIPTDKNNNDATYSCVFSSTEHGVTDQKTEVSSKVFTVSPGAKPVTTAIKQTLRCTVGDLDQAVKITWKGPDGTIVTDDDNYDISAETVINGGKQVSILTIKADKMADYADETSFTYACSAKSEQYTDSPESKDFDVVATVLDLAVIAVNKEQLKQTEATLSCKITGLTKQLDKITWTKSDGTLIISGQDGITIDDGILDDNSSQTTTLTVSGDENGQDTTFTCVITSLEHGVVERSTTVSLEVFSVTPMATSITTAIDQTLTCSIGGLTPNGNPATVEWKDPDEITISSNNNNYVINSGSPDDVGSQAAELTIKPEQLRKLTSSTVYKCSVKSGKYSMSPATDFQDVKVAVQKALVIAGVHKEQLSGTEAKISCKISGLTKQLDEVKWRKSNDSPITSGQDDYIIDTGDYNDGSQTSTLTVSGALNEADSTYACLVTSEEWAVEDKSTIVMLDVFTLTPTARKVTTMVDQKLTCTISGLRPNEPAATVTWTDPDEVTVTLSNKDYSISQGTVDSSGTQVAELTITPVKLGTLAVTSTYKCSAQSGKYPASPLSPSRGVLVTVLSIASQSTGSEVLAGQKAVISCAFTGITQQLDFITWLRSDGTLVSFLDNFEVEVGDYNRADNSQVTTLTVLGAENSVDNIYICQFTSLEWARVDDRSTTVPINIFAVLPRGKKFSFAVAPSGEEISTATPQTISCDISGLSAPADIVWIKPDGIEVEKDDNANYLVEDGRDSFVEDGGFQTTKLTLKVPVVEITSSAVTYRCSVRSEEFSKSPAFSTDVVIERKTYTVVGASRDVLAGSVATLTCSVTGSSVAEIGIVWVEENGNVYAASNINTDHKVKETIVGENSKESTLKLSKKVTVNKAQTFKCRVTLEESTDPVEIEVPLKTFTVITFGVEIRSGQPATLTCKVIEPTDSLVVNWYYDDGLEIGGGTQETISDNTIISKLTEYPRNDANYTCRVTGEYRYEFYAEVLIDDIILNPAGEIRSLTGSEVILTCGFISKTISEGSFQWKHNEEPCITAACLSPTETPVLSMVKITVEDGTAGEWKCSFIKAKNNREVKSEVVTITKVELSGTQTPASLWGLAGEEAEVSCVVPYGLTFSELTPDNIEWIFDRYAISEQGVGLNQNNEVSFFSFGEKVTSATSLTWSVTFSHTDTSVGPLKCRATYDSGQQIETPPSYLNLITLSSDVDYIVMTPNTGAVVTFITQAKVYPTSSIVMTSGNFRIQSTEEEAINDGIHFTEVIEFSTNSVDEVNSKEDLSVKHYPYTYTVYSEQPDEISVSGTASLVGETFVDNALVWVTVGGRAKFTAYFTAVDRTGVKVAWEQEGTNGWVDLMANGYSVLLSELDDKNVMSTVLLIDEIGQSEITKYRAQVEVAGSVKTTDSVTVKFASAIVSDQLVTVFEGGSISFTVTIIGPSKPTNVVLKNAESGKENQVDLTHVSSSSPFQISHQIGEVYAGDQGSYSFKVTFDSGLKVESDTVNLVVKRRCKPFTIPPNTQLTEVALSDSNDYKITVICIQGSYVFMDENQIEAVCDTDSGAFDTYHLSPCFRTIEVPVEEPEEEESGNSYGNPANDSSGELEGNPANDSSGESEENSADDSSGESEGNPTNDSSGESEGNPTDDSSGESEGNPADDSSGD